MTKYSDENADLPTVSGHLSQKILKELYRAVRGRKWRHNVHLWPYTRVSRDDKGHISAIRVFNRDIPIISVDEAFANASPDMHIILSGSSVLDIDYSQLPKLQSMGVNGSIALQDRHDIDFPFYCVIDRSFARTQRRMIERIVSKERVFLLGPDVLRYILEYIPMSQIRCRLCIIEDITERAYAPRPDNAALEAMQQRGADIVVFNDQIPLGFSFDSGTGWFDADTVAYTALQAAIWGGVRRVYFHGLDIKNSETIPRFYEEDGKRPTTRLEKNFETFIEPSFRAAVTTLQARGVEVYNLSANSALGPEVIPFLNWRELA